MKAGVRDFAEFWISLNERKIHVRYFAQCEEMKSLITIKTAVINDCQIMHTI